MSPQDRLTFCLAKASFSMPLQAAQAWQDILRQSLVSLTHLNRASSENTEDHLQRLCQATTWPALANLPAHMAQHAAQQQAVQLGMACHALAQAQGATARAWMSAPGARDACCEGTDLPAGVLPFDCLAQAWQSLWQTPPTRT